MVHFSADCREIYRGVPFDSQFPDGSSAQGFRPVGGHRLSTNLSHLFSHFSYPFPPLPHSLREFLRALINGQGGGDETEFMVAAARNEERPLLIIMGNLPVRFPKIFHLELLRLLAVLRESSHYAAPAIGICRCSFSSSSLYLLCSLSFPS